MLMNIEIHHHGSFNSDARNRRYIGGYVDIIKDFDTDVLSFRDLEDFAGKCHYNAYNPIHFISDAKNMRNGMRLLYDDHTIRECVDVCKPFHKIVLYVDHSFSDDIAAANEKGKKIVVDEGEEEWDASEDEDYAYKETETEDSDSDGSFYIESDEELRENKIKGRLIRNEMRKSMAAAPFEESDFDSDELRSIASSSEDENRQIGYIGSIALLILAFPKFPGSLFIQQRSCPRQMLSLTCQ